VKLVWKGDDRFRFESDGASPELAPNEVAVRVRAVGICGTDIHILKGLFPLSKPPLVLGHEIAGEIAAVGKRVTNVHEGDRVTVDQVVGCGHCEFCRRGSYQFCADGFELGITRDGGCQSFIVVPENNIHRVPDTMTFEEAAILDMEVFAALQKAALKAEDSILIVGAGPAGLIAAQIAVAFGVAKVMLAEKRLGRRRQAERIAPQSLVLSPDDETFHSRLLAETRGAGPEVVMDCAGTSESFNLSLESVSPGGRVVLYGVHEKPVAAFDPNRIVLKDLSLYGALSDRTGWEQVIEYAVTGRLQLGPLITHRFPFDRAPEAYAFVRSTDETLLKAVLLLP
jgi:2-desacetyl-2-hydroxyethyl bacteriochlorophyllide A dehydrogenase